MSNGLVSFAEVKRAVPLEAILEHYGLSEGLTHKGQNLVGSCPFCNGKSTRQFQVNPVKNAWYCFGCKQGGNVLDFVAKREGMSVRAAAVTLNSWFALGLAEEAPRADPAAAPAKAEQAEKEALPAPEKVLPTRNPPLAFTLKTLDSHHEELAALGLGASALERFGAGYCTKGLLKGRLAIPVHNSSGELVAYAGLAVQANETPRYLFPPRFNPALEIMNLHRLVEFSHMGGPLYVVPEIEGVLQLAKRGTTRAIGLFDGSLSSAQEEAIAGAISPYEQLMLVGEGFEDRTVVRLARHAPVTWLPELPKEPHASELRGKEEA